jgi:hypothetical protein
MPEIKKRKRFVYEGFGFPIVLRNVPMIKVRGVWTPNVDYNKLSTEVLLALARKPSRLTGNEVRFIRHHFEMTLSQFGDLFAVSHPAVLKWEDSQDEPTSMKWPIEKDMRMFILDALDVEAAELATLYRTLRKEVKPTGKPIEMNIDQAA